MLLKLISLAQLCLLVAAAPTSSQSANVQAIQSWYNARDRSLAIKATTTTPMKQTVHWIERDSQGKIASPPPAISAKANFATPELAMPGAELGPEGTVPVLGKNLAGLNYANPLAVFLNKSASTGGVHRYGSSQQPINNYGTQGTLELWKPYVQTNGDFSLLQTGIVNTQGTEQTCEAGWHVFPGFNGDSNVHLFTYFTTNGYASTGDNVGGYNRDVAGWVQVSSTIFPGTVWSDPSTIGGSLTAIGLQYQLHEGNWWLGVNGAWIGYYPASLYARGGTTSGTLGNVGSVIGWWGEIYDDQTQDGGRTTTDMGNGLFPGTNAAYMSNLMSQTDTAGTLVNYVGSDIDQPDPSMYQIETFWNSGSSFGSWAYVGGPGSG